MSCLKRSVFRFSLYTLSRTKETKNMTLPSICVKSGIESRAGFALHTVFPCNPFVNSRASKVINIVWNDIFNTLYNDNE